MNRYTIFHLGEERSRPSQRQLQTLHPCPRDRIAWSFKLLLTDTEKQLARAKFEHHFGALALDFVTTLDNESIDADLAQEYASPHEED